MFELIGVLVVLWIAYAAIKVFIKNDLKVSSRKIAKKVSSLAHEIYGIPESYVNFSLYSKKSKLKQAMVLVGEGYPYIKRMPSEEKIAAVICVEFLEAYLWWDENGSFEEQCLFNALGIEKEDADMIYSSMSDELRAIARKEKGDDGSPTPELQDMFDSIKRDMASSKS